MSLDTQPAPRPPMAGLGWPSSVRRAVITYNSPSPIGASLVRAISVVYGRAMDWRSRGWRSNEQSDGDSGMAYRGYEAALQSFKGGMVTPSAASVRYGLNQLLPGTTSLPNDARTPQGYTLPASSVMDLLPGAPGA